MAYLRLLFVILLLLAFLVIGAPLQWLLRRSKFLPQSLVPRLFGRMACAALGLRIRQHGEPLREFPQLVVSNHVSWTDVLVLQSSHSCRFLAKREVAAWPVLGWFARLQGSIFVDRTKRMGIPRVNAAMARSMLDGAPVVLFGEGTTGDGTRVKRFHSSHFASARDALALDPRIARIAIQPVAIAYLRRDGLPLGRSGRSTIAWYGEMTFVPHIWRMLRHGPVDCELIFGPPLRFERGDDRKLMARRTRRVIHQLVSRANAGRLGAGADVVNAASGCSLGGQNSLQQSAAEALGTGQA